ncbi:MAG: carbon-nitrogen hydrolase family protein [Ghiorsea sp.]
MDEHNLRVACIQLNSADDIAQNLANISEILAQHRKDKLDLLLLSENATLLSSHQAKKSKYAQKAEYLALFDYFSQLAKEHQLWLVAGSLLIQDDQHPERNFNHCPVFSPDGTMVNAYNKIHLFDADLGSESWLESEHISPGDTPQTQALTHQWKLGLSICYDLRFPELYRYYAEQGCNIFTVPAAFTVPTGQAHWETLLRARAIENQAYVLAAGQWGKHADGRKTYGHSMIIDPWGKVLCQLEQGEGLIYADLSFKALTKLQQRMPVLKHRQLS